MNKEELLAELSRKTGRDLNQIDTFYESLIQIITEKALLWRGSAPASGMGRLYAEAVG